MIHTNATDTAGDDRHTQVNKECQKLTKQEHRQKSTKITKSTTVENIDIDKKSRKMNKIDKICRHKRYRAERSRRKGRDPHNTSKTNNNKVYTYGFGTYCCRSLVCVFVMDDINNNKVLQQKVRSYYDDIIPSLQLPTQQITTRDNMRTNTHHHTTATS